MSIDIDAIEARANAAGVFNNQKELLKVFNAAEASLAAAAQSALMELQDVTLRTATEELKADNAALCAEVRKLRSALEQARAALEEIANSLEADGCAPLSLAVAKAALLAAASGGAA